jgi:hypothetical protein
MLAESLNYGTRKDGRNKYMRATMQELILAVFSLLSL